MAGARGWRRRLGWIGPLLALTGCTLQHGTVPPAVETAHFDDAALVTQDGARLPLKAWLPTDESGALAPVRTVVVALHGFNDHDTAFAAPAAIWQGQGIATYAYDQRGFGTNADRGFWAGQALMVRDLDDAIAAARARHPGVRIVALGESMGGAVILAGLGGRSGAPIPSPDAVVLVAPAVWGRDTMRIYERLALWFAIRAIPDARFTGRGFGVLPSDNLPMLRAFSRDPLVIKETRVDAIYGLVDLMDAALDAIPQALPPTLVLYGAHDQLIPADALRATLGHLAPAGPARLAFYPKGWHMLLRDLEGADVAHDVASWIGDPQASLALGRADLPAAGT